MDLAVLGLEVRSDGVAVASTRLDDLQKSAATAEKSTDNLKASMGDLQKTSETTQKATDRLSASLEKLVKFAAGLFALNKIVDYTKGFATAAANAQALGMAMEQAGQRAGYSAAEMAKFDRILQNADISISASRQQLTALAAAEADLQKTTQLASAAQNLSITSTKSATEAFKGLTKAILSGHSETLSTMGLTVNFDKAYKELAKTLGKTSSALTENEKVTARMNATLESAAKLTGTYTATMESAVTKWGGIQAMFESLEASLGQITLRPLGDALDAIGVRLREFHAYITELSADGTLQKWGENLSAALAFVANNFNVLLVALTTYVSAQSLASSIIGKSITEYAKYTSVVDALKTALIGKNVVNLAALETEAQITREASKAIAAEIAQKEAALSTTYVRSASVNLQKEIIALKKIETVVNGEQATAENALAAAKARTDLASKSLLTTLLNLAKNPFLWAGVAVGALALLWNKLQEGNKAIQDGARLFDDMRRSAQGATASIESLTEAQQKNIQLGLQQELKKVTEEYERQKRLFESYEPPSMEQIEQQTQFVEEYKDQWDDFNQVLGDVDDRMKDLEKSTGGASEKMKGMWDAMRAQMSATASASEQLNILMSTLNALQEMQLAGNASPVLQEMIDRIKAMYAWTEKLAQAQDAVGKSVYQSKGAVDLLGASYAQLQEQIDKVLASEKASFATTAEAGAFLEKTLKNTKALKDIEEQRNKERIHAAIAMLEHLKTEQEYEIARIQRRTVMATMDAQEAVIQANAAQTRLSALAEYLKGTQVEADLKVEIALLDAKAAKAEEDRARLQAAAVEAQKKLLDLAKKIDAYSAGAKQFGVSKSEAKAAEKLSTEIKETEARIKSLKEAMEGWSLEPMAREQRKITLEYDKQMAAAQKIKDLQLRGLKEQEAELTKQYKLKELERREEEKQLQNAQEKLNFYRRLEELSGQYGLSLEFQNEVLQMQADLYMKIRGIPKEMVDEWVRLEKLQLSHEGIDGITRAMTKFVAEASNAAKQLESIFSTAIRGIDSGFQSMWEKFFEDGKLSLDSFSSLFKKFLAQLAHYALTQPITVYLAQSVQGMLGLGGSGSNSLMGGVTSLFSGSAGGASGGSLGNYLSGAKSLYDYGSKAWNYASDFFAGTGMGNFGGAGSLYEGIGTAQGIAEAVAYSDSFTAAMEAGATAAEAMEVASSAAASSASNMATAASSASGAMAGFAGVVGSVITLATVAAKGQASKTMSTYGGLVAGAAIGSIGGPIGAGIGAALGALVGSLFGGGGRNKDAVRVQSLLNLTNDQAFLSGSAMQNIAELQQGKDGFATEAGNYLTFTRSNKSDPDVWDSAYDLRTVTNAAMDYILTTTKEVADIIPESIREQWWNSAAMQETMSFGGTWKDKNITAENFQEWANDVAKDVQKQWAKGFLEIDFSDWEYAGKLVVDQPQLRGELTQDLVKAVDNMQSTGVEALRDIVNNQSLVDLLHAEIMRTQPEWTKDLYLTGEQRLEMNTPEYIRGVLEKELAKWDSEISAREAKYYIDDNGEQIRIQAEEADKDRLTGREIVVSLFDMVRGKLGSNNTGPDFNWITMDNLADNLHEIQASQFDDVQAAFDKFIAALSGMATIESIISNIENPVEPISQWVTDALAAVEQMNAHQAEYLDNTGWTDEAIAEVMGRYRSAVTQSFLDQIDEALNPLSDLQARTKEQIDTVNEWIKALDILGATEEQIAQIEAVRANIQQSLLDQARQIVNPVTQIVSAVDSVNAAFDDLIGAMEIAGSSISDVIEAEHLRVEAINAARLALTQPFYDDLTLRAMTAAGADTTVAQQNITHRDQLSTAKNTFGAGSIEYEALLAVQEAEKMKTAADQAAAWLAELESQLKGFSDAAKSAASAAEAARLAFVKGLISDLDSAESGIKKAVDAWANAAKSAWETAAKALLSSLQSELSANQALADRMSQARSNLWTDTSLNQADTVYGSAKAEIERLYASAQAGDKDAATQFASKAKSFLDSSYGYQGEYSDYIKDFDDVQAMLRTLENEALSQVDALQAEIDLLQEQLDQQSKTNRTLDELRADMIAARAEYERAHAEQMAAYERWGFEELGNDLAALEAAYYAAVELWINAQKAIDEAILAGITTQMEIDSLRVLSKMDELKAAMEAANAASAAASSQANDAALLAAIEAAKALSGAANQAALDAALAALEKVSKAEEASKGSSLYQGKYNSPYELLEAKANAMNEGRTLRADQSAGGWTANSVMDAITRDGLTLDEWYRKYGKLEGFATGGIATAGLALVGEDGPEIVNLSQRAGIFPADVTRALLSMPAAGTDGDSRAEIAMLREQNARSERLLQAVLAKLAAIEKNTKGGKQVLEQIADEGIGTYEQKSAGSNAPVKKTEFAN